MAMGTWNMCSSSFLWAILPQSLEILYKDREGVRGDNHLKFKLAQAQSYLKCKLAQAQSSEEDSEDSLPVIDSD